MASLPPEPLPRVAGWAAFGVYTALLVVGATVRCPCAPGLVWTMVALGIVFASLPLLGVAGRRPLVELPGSVLASAAVAVICFGTGSNPGWFAILVPLGWCVLSQAFAVSLGYAAAVMALFAGQAIAYTDTGWIPWLAGTAFTVMVCTLRRREHAVVLQLREAQAGLAQRAQSEERARIARELHDVVAHSLTVSLMHVSAARLALAEDPDDAERALAEAERLGRASLDEVRHAVGTLRRDGAPDPTAPLPGSTDLPGLIAGFERAGVDVHATLDGELTGLPATVGLATYRIVQEALTNAVKHAPGRRVTVHVAVTGREVRIDIDSAGTPGHGAGLGLVGMRERAASVAGTCESGPGGSGWRVHAELPLNEVSAR